MRLASSFAFIESRFYSCPLADGLSVEGWASDLLDVFRRSQRGEHLTNLVPDPTVGAWEVMEMLGAEVRLVDALVAQFQREAAEKAASR